MLISFQSRLSAQLPGKGKGKLVYICETETSTLPHNRSNHNFYSPIPHTIVARPYTIAIAFATMSRRTRAALKAEMVLEDNTATEEAAMKMSTRSQRNREPLRPLTPNSVESADAEKPDQDMAGNKKGKKKGKGGKKNAKRAKAGTMTDEENANQQVGEVEDDGEDNNFGDSVASAQGPEHDQDNPKGMLRARMVRFIEKGKSRLKRTGSHIFRSSRSSFEGQSDDSVVDYIPNERPASPSVKAGRKGRRQAPEPEPKVRLPKEPVVQAGTDFNSAEQEHQKVNPTPSATEVPGASSQDPTLDAPTLTEQSSAAEALSFDKIVSARAGGVKSPIEGIEAMDALQDELDEVIKGLPNLDDSPDSPIKAAHPPVELTTKATKSATSKTAAPKTKPVVPAAKSTLNRTPSVRTATANKLTKTTQPSTLSRSNSVKTSTNSNQGPTNATTRPAPAKPRPSSMFVSRDDAPKSADGKATDYLASRRRPISMQFPTPPPPPRSGKAPTKPTFTLPGDAITAKLKAAREERKKREEEEERKRREFKARPVPGSVKAGAAVKQTASSRARQSVVFDGVDGVQGGKENRPAITTGGAAAGGLKRSSTVTGATSSSKRGSVVMGRPAAAVPGAKAKDASVAAKDKEKRASTAANLTRTASLSVPKRQSISGLVSGTSSALSNRVPSNNSSTVGAATNGAKINKGREVFNRDRLEKEARERDRKEKEEAAKKARAEAAERGRQASREWAERQRRKVEEEKARRVAEAAAAAS